MRFPCEGSRELPELPKSAEGCSRLGPHNQIARPIEVVTRRAGKSATIERVHPRLRVIAPSRLHLEGAAPDPGQQGLVLVPRQLGLREEQTLPGPRTSTPRFRRPSDDRADFTATIYHCLGIKPDTETHDLGGRPMIMSHGKPIATLVG